MKRYDAFISYRKSTVAYADLVFYSLISAGFDKNRIFQDKHDIGPEQFDERIKGAVEQSNSLIIIVSKDCFIRKDQEEDWFLEEISVALREGITIIPVLFDNIKSLADTEIKPLIEKEFEDYVDYLTHQQSIEYHSYYSQSSLETVSLFVKQATKKERLTILERIVKKAASISVVIIAFAVAFVLFLLLSLSIGLFIGYITTPKDVEKIVERYSEQHLSTINLELEGLCASYNINTGVIEISDSSFVEINPKKVGFNGFSSAIIASISISSSMHTLAKSFNMLEPVSRYAKNKGGKIAVVAGYVGVTLGTLCGGVQGFHIGKKLKIEGVHDEIMEKIKNRDTWINIAGDSFLYKKVGGIGISFNQYDNMLEITNVLEGGPADLAGLRIGDKIVKVNAETITSTSNPVNMITGEEGSTVSLTVERENKVLTFEIVRNSVIINVLPSTSSEPNIEERVLSDEAYSQSRRISNPSAIIMSPIDTLCQAFQNGIRESVVVLQFCNWNIKQEIDTETFRNIYVEDNGRLAYSDSLVYGYWQEPMTSVELPRFIIRKIASIDYQGLQWRIVVFDRNEYDTMKKEYTEWQALQ